MGCREIFSKRTLVRIVRTAEGVQIDPTGKLAGRGAYLHDHYECWDRALKGALAHALKTTFTSQERTKLEDFMSTLPQDAGGGRDHVTV